ncbi:MAG: DNA-binding protein WhiA [Clostridia bacterium]|nr:DNA-binding protein WhiA [Clostridia bacterium]
MSFCSEIKKEISASPLPHACCRNAFAYGLLQGGHAFGLQEMSIQTEHRAVAASYAAVITALFEDVSFFEQTMPRKNGSYYTVSIADESDRRSILDRFGHSGHELSLRLNRANLDCDFCAAAYVRGAFLACGAVSDPETDYHLEMSVPSHKLSGDILTLLSESGMPFKHILRKGCNVLYLKDSDRIADFLAWIGAQTGSLQVYQAVMYKNIRNKVNRQTNCESANLDKTVAAASGQIQAVQKIERNGGIASLPDDLQELAQLRLLHPEYSLRELAEALDPPLTRSGVNHRLKRLMDFAADLPD